MTGFSNAWILIFLAIIPVGLYLYREMTKKKKKQAIGFSHLSFIKSALGDKKKSRRGDLLFYLSLGIVALMIIGFSDPRIPLEQTHEGVNVVLIMDVSGSMKATDYLPNRLEAAKESAITLVKSLEVNDHVGVVLFENGATTGAYLSPFKDNVIEKIRGIVQREGKTAVGDGLATGIDMATSIPNKKKVAILLSDGVSNSGVISPDEAIVFAKDNNIQVYTIGMGSTTPTVLGYDWFGNPQYAELDEGTLIKIAEETGGRYFKSVDSSTLKDVYKNIGDEIEREREETPIGKLFFLLGLLLLIVEIYLRYGRRRIIQ
ncbi:MAG: VWA domain-containing protein [Nanoarchaeota archaeon]|nr:VWA domain-containing protein [Nanoarchaeota archaeon]